MCFTFYVKAEQYKFNCLFYAVNIMLFCIKNSFSCTLSTIPVTHKYKLYLVSP